MKYRVQENTKKKKISVGVRFSAYFRPGMRPSQSPIPCVRGIFSGKAAELWR
jgi:hypothetical protein